MKKCNQGNQDSRGRFKEYNPWIKTRQEKQTHTSKNNNTYKETCKIYTVHKKYLSLALARNICNTHVFHFAVILEFDKGIGHKHTKGYQWQKLLKIIACSMWFKTVSTEIFSLYLQACKYNKYNFNCLIWWYLVRILI